MIQVGCAGAGISSAAPAVKLLPVIDFMESAHSSFLSSELFPVPHSPQMAPTAPWVFSRFAGIIFFTGSMKQTGMWQLKHLGCSKVFLCCRSRPDWRLVLPVNGTAHPALPVFRRTCAIYIHALEPNSFSQAGSDGVSWYKENQIDFHNRTAITEAHHWSCSRLRWGEILDSLKEPESNIFFSF